MDDLEDKLSEMSMIITKNNTSLAAPGAILGPPAAILDFRGTEVLHVVSECPLRCKAGIFFQQIIHGGDKKNLDGGTALLWGIAPPHSGPKSWCTVP